MPLQMPRLSHLERLNLRTEDTDRKLRNASVERSLEHRFADQADMEQH